MLWTPEEDDSSRVIGCSRAHMREPPDLRLVGEGIGAASQQGTGTAGERGTAHLDCTNGRVLQPR